MIDEIDVVEREAAAIGAVLRTGPLTAAVPTCPGWTLADLLSHVGGFAGFWTHVLCDGRGDSRPPYVEPVDADGWDRVAADLLAGLRDTPADTEVWTWAPGHDRPAFIARRAAHELAVHWVDAQSALGWPDPIATEVAVDGIEEIFTMVAAYQTLGWTHRSGAGTGETLALDAADGPSWHLRLAPAGLTVARERGPADLTLAGSASDLELMLYGRPPLAAVERRGDLLVLDAWHRGFQF